MQHRDVTVADQQPWMLLPCSAPWLLHIPYGASISTVEPHIGRPLPHSFWCRYYASSINRHSVCNTKVENQCQTAIYSKCSNQNPKEKVEEKSCPSFTTSMRQHLEQLKGQYSGHVKPERKANLNHLLQTPEQKLACTKVPNRGMCETSPKSSRNTLSQYWTSCITITHNKGDNFKV